jgi:3-oxoadipate enol-lactonase
MTTIDLEEYVLPRNGCELHYWLTGPKNQPLMIMTHGAWINHHEFELQLADFTKQYRLLLWDVRGHGLSRPADPHFSVKEAVQDLLSLLDSQKVDTAILLGHSMGGNLIQEVAFYHPERVKALVCIGCTCNTLKLNPLETLGVKMTRPIFELYPFDMLRRQSADISSNQAAARQKLYEMFSGSTKADFVNIMLELTRCLHYEPQYQIKNPLLILVGDQDKTGNIRKVAPIWAERDKGSELVIIPNAGHAVNMDQPELVNQHVLTFLKRVLK